MKGIKNDHLILISNLILMIYQPHKWHEYQYQPSKFLLNLLINSSIKFPNQLKIKCIKHYSLNHIQIFPLKRKILLDLEFCIFLFFHVFCLPPEEMV